MAKSDNQFSLNNFLTFLNKHFSLVLIILIVLVIGFLGGSLWTENQMLKSDKTIAPENQAVEPVANPDDALALDKIPTVSDSDHVRGAKNADVTIISYSDFACPYCQKWHPTFNSLVEKYGDQITFVYRHFSLGFTYSDKLAQTSECVAEYANEEAFWTFTDTIYEKLADRSIYTKENDSEIITDESILTIAANSGAPLAKVQACLESQEKAEVVQNMMMGASAAGIGGTPSTIIISKNADREFIPGALTLEEVESTLEKHL